MSAATADAALPGLLRRYRLAAGLSQEALAERAGLSARAVSDLERGLRRLPYPATLARLAEALGLEPPERAALLTGRQAEGPAATEVELRPRPAPSPGRLGRELSSFVGRHHELARIDRLLTEAPLVTLAGPGGAGKTRLALRLARAVAEGSSAVQADDVVLVELAPIADPRLVPRAVADALGVTDDPGQPLLGTLTHALGTRPVLLVLDNCEHLVTVCADLVDALLRACAGLRVLATSREPLGVEGEVVFRVPPLRLPADEGLDACAVSEAAQLFVQRVRAVRGDFALDSATAPAVARVCRRLAGLPLAIELAAARVASLSLADIADRLDTANRFLTSSSRSAPPRQRTLQAAIAWSYDLLVEDERRLFERLSVFQGTFQLDQAEAVAATDGATADTAEVLGRLVTRSMVQLEPLPDGAVRYRLLEPLRQFGRERVLERGELDHLRRRHARSMVELLERAESDLEAGRRQIEWFQRIELELDNLRAALEWAEADGDTELGLRLSAPLRLYWTRPNRRGEGRARLQRILAMPHADAHPGLRARVVGILAFVTASQADLPTAAALVEDALAGARAGGDLKLEADMLRMAGQVRLFAGELSQADDLLRHALDLAHSSGSRSLEVLARLDLASLATARGELAMAEEHLRAAARIATTYQQTWAEAMALNGLGDLLRARGDTDGAADAYQRALPTLQAMNGDHPPEGMLHNLAYVALARGDPTAAVSLFLDSADRYRALGGDRRGLAECVVGLACAALRLERADLAARLFGAAAATLERLGSSLTPSNRTDYERGRTELACALAPARLARLEAEGRELRLEDAVDQARGLAALAVGPTPARVAGPTADLTAREREVAELLARGYRNRQIAEALVITEKTAANHVQRVLEKLGLSSRAQVAARAAELGLVAGRATSAPA